MPLVDTDDLEYEPPALSIEINPFAAMMEYVTPFSEYKATKLWWHKSSGVKAEFMNTQRKDFHQALLHRLRHKSPFTMLEMQDDCGQSPAVVVGFVRTYVHHKFIKVIETQDKNWKSSQQVPYRYLVEQSVLEFIKSPYPIASTKDIALAKPKRKRRPAKPSWL